jgi:hypothetical protein
MTARNSRSRTVMRGPFIAAARRTSRPGPRSSSPHLLPARARRSLHSDPSSSTPSCSAVAAITKLRFSTLIILPEKEEILDFTTGDKEFWIINGAHNLCYIHPAQAGIRSNLNLITAGGHV